MVNQRIKKGNRSSNRLAANGLVFFGDSLRVFRLYLYENNHSAIEYTEGA